MNFHKLLGQPLILLKPIGQYAESSVELAPAFYKCFETGPERTITFEQIVEKQKLTNFKSGIICDIIDKITKFFSPEIVQKYLDLKIIHKMGILLHGKPGVGKTSCVQLIINQVIAEHKAICLDFTGRYIFFMIDAVQEVRRLCPNSPIVVFIDEFEIVANNPDILSFLDGVDSVNKCLFVGCTNFVDKIPERVLNRKGRIKHTFEVKSLPLLVYKDYILEKIPGITSEKAYEFAFKSEEADLTIDQLKNAVTDYYIDGMTIEQAIEEARNQIKFESA